MEKKCKNCSKFKDCTMKDMCAHMGHEYCRFFEKINPNLGKKIEITDEKFVRILDKAKQTLSTAEIIDFKPGYRLKYMGYFIKLHSGKHMWSSKQAVSSAITNFLCSSNNGIYSFCRINKVPYSMITKELINQGVLEIVELNELS